MSIRSLRPALCAVVLHSALAAAQSPPPLTFDQALHLAEERSRQLPAQEASAAAAREMAVAAGRLPDPSLKLGLNNLPIDGPDAWSTTSDFMTMRSIGLMQEFTSGDKRRARAARFEREAAAAEAGRTLALTTLRRETALAWLDRHFLDRTRELVLAQRAEAALQVDAADAAYRGGRGAQADVFAARAMVARLDDRLRQTELQAVAAQARLARWVGEPAGRPLAAPPSLERVTFAAQAAGADWERHPQVALLAQQQAVARADAELARSNRHSDWSAELMYNQRGSSYSNMVSINVSIPLQLDAANRQDRELAARLALAEQAREQQEEAARDAAAETASWLAQWRITRERVAQFDAALIPLARERTRAALAAYRGGRGALDAVLDARRAEIETQLERLRVEMDAATLWARLETLLPPQAAAPAPAADAKKESLQ
jgi:outer membrane protein TolC